jgi:pilus assembly protein CpaC
MRRFIIALAGLFTLLRPAAAAVSGKKIPVEVRVEVAEVDHSKASSLGVEWGDSISIAETSRAGIVSIGAVDRLTDVQATLHFLVQEGAAELLANPNLMTDSGTAATFHAGGEIPYITAAALGATHVEFKPYGVELNVKPTVLDSGQIAMVIKAAVSSPDNSNGVSLSGNRVPALLERQVTSNVTVSAGETITLAGLVQTHKEEIKRGVPFLSKVPVLGMLFRWTQKNFRRTTVVMFVTPLLGNR